MNNTIVIDNISTATLAQRNRVLRNTYWLLALSMIPTVLGAYIGVQTGIMASLRGGLGLIVFLAGALFALAAMAALVPKDKTAHIKALIATRISNAPLIFGNQVCGLSCPRFI